MMPGHAAQSLAAGLQTMSLGIVINVMRSRLLGHVQILPSKFAICSTMWIESGSHDPT